MIRPYQTWPQPWRSLFVPVALALLLIAVLMEFLSTVIYELVDW